MKITKLFNKFIALTVTICLIVSVTSADAFSAVQSPKETDMPVISLDNGKITSVNDTGSNLTVVNIQDLHCHKETQKKISNIIEEINKENKVKEIYVEGGYDKIDVGWLNEIKDKKVKEQIVDQLLEDGEITAGEYYAAMKDNNVQLKGLDEKVTHQQNLKRLSRIMNDQDRYASVISKVRNEIARLNDRYINYENRKFSEKIKEYKNEGGDSGRLYIKLFKYIDRINENFDQYNNITKIVKENYPNMATYIRLDKESKRINPEEISNQVKAILTDLKAVLSYSEYSDIIAKTNNLRDINKLVWYINKYTTEKNINLSKYGSLSKFLEIRQMTASLNPVKLLEEERDLIEQIRYALSYDKTEYEIAYISDFEEYFEKYLKYGLTSTDWHFTKKGFNKFRQLYAKYAVVDRIKEIEQDFVELDKYYNTNDERNSIFVNNILDGQKADNIAKPGTRTVKDIIKDSKEVIIVVAGGYHSDELSNMLSEESVNDIVITPNITGDIEKASNKYKQTIKEQAILQAQALAFRIASCLDDITQQKLLLKAGMEALKKGNINEREIENIIKVIKVNDKNNGIDIEYENGEFKLNGNSITLDDIKNIPDENNDFYEAVNAAIKFFEDAINVFDPREFNTAYIATVNRLVFSVAVLLSDSNGLPSIEAEQILKAENIKELTIDGQSYSFENFLLLGLDEQAKLINKVIKKRGKINKPFYLGDENDTDVEKFDNYEFLEKYKQYCENNKPLNKKEESLLNKALGEVKNTMWGRTLYGVDPNEFIAILEEFNRNGDGKLFDKVINRDVLSFFANSKNYYKYDSIPGYQLIFVNNFKIEDYINDEESETRLVNLLEEIQDIYPGDREYLAIENDALAIKLFLNGQIGKELNFSNIISEYEACIKIARYLAFYTGENTQTILEIFNYDLNKIQDKDEKNKLMYEREGLIQTGIQWYKAQNKIAQNIDVLNENTKIFEFNAYQKDKGFYSYNMFQPSIVSEFVDKYGLEENYHVLNVSKNDNPEERLNEFFNEIKQTNIDEQIYIRFNTHGHANRVVYFYDDGNKENLIEYRVTVDDFVELINYFAENGYNEKNIVFDLSSCHSYEFVLNIYEKLKEENIDFYPSFIVATGLETEFGYSVYIETVDREAGVVKGRPVLKSEFKVKGPALIGKLNMDEILAVTNLWYHVYDEIKNKDNFDLKIYDFSKQNPYYANHTAFIASPIAKEVNGLINKQIESILNGNEKEYSEINDRLEKIINLKNYDEFEKEVNELSKDYGESENAVPYAELSILGNDKTAPVWEEILFGGIVTGLIAAFTIANPLVTIGLFILARLGFIGAHSIREYFKDGKDKNEIWTNFKARLFPTTLLSIPYAIVLFCSCGAFLPPLVIATGTAIIIHRYWNNNEEKIKIYLSKIPLIKNLPYLEMNVLKEESKYKDDVDVLENAIKNNQIENVTARATTDSYSSPLFMSLIYKGEDSRYYQGEDEDTGKYNVSKELNSGTVINLSISDFAVFAGNDLNNFSYALTYFFNRASYQDGPTILDEIEGLDDEYKEEVLYFLYESFKNALYHGNKLDSDEPVYIWLEKSKKGLTFKVANRVNDIQRDRRLEEKAEMIGITGKGAAHNKMSGWADADDNIIFETGETSDRKYYVSSFTIINVKEEDKVLDSVDKFPDESFNMPKIEIDKQNEKNYKDFFDNSFYIRGILTNNFDAENNNDFRSAFSAGNEFEFKRKETVPSVDEENNPSVFREEVNEKEKYYLEKYNFDSLYKYAKENNKNEHNIRILNYFRIMQNKSNNSYLRTIIEDENEDIRVRLLAYGYYMKENGSDSKLNIENLKEQTKIMMRNNSNLNDYYVNPDNVSNYLDLRAVGSGIALILLNEKDENGKAFIELDVENNKNIYGNILKANIIKEGYTALAKSGMFFAGYSIYVVAHEIGHNIFYEKRETDKYRLDFLEYPTLSELCAYVCPEMLNEIVYNKPKLKVMEEDNLFKLYNVKHDEKDDEKWIFRQQHIAARSFINLIYISSKNVGFEMSFCDFYKVLLEINIIDIFENSNNQSELFRNILDHYFDFLSSKYAKDKEKEKKLESLKNFIQKENSWKGIIKSDIFDKIKENSLNGIPYAGIIYRLTKEIGYDEDVLKEFVPEFDKKLENEDVFVINAVVFSQPDKFNKVSKIIKEVINTYNKSYPNNDKLNEVLVTLDVIEEFLKLDESGFVKESEIYDVLKYIEDLGLDKSDNELRRQGIIAGINKVINNRQNISSAALLPENKNEVRRFAENNYETLNFKTMLKKSIEMAYKEFSPSFSSKFVRNHYDVDKQTAKNLQKVTIASSAIFGILGFVSIALNPVVYVAIPVVFAIAALISGTNMAYHTAIIYRYINSIKDIKDDFGNAVRIEDNNETYLSVYVTNDIGKYDGKKMPLGENINGNQVYKINKDGFIIVGVNASEISSEEIIKNLDAGLLGSKTKGMNINKIVIDNNISDEFDVTEDGTITINGNILDKLNSSDKIKFIKSALSVKTANGTTMADSTIFDLRTMPFNDNIYGQDAKRDFKLKFENTPGRIIISKTEDDQLPTVGLDYKTEDIENLKYEGKYVFVDYGKEKPDTDQIEYLKKSARSGYTYIKDNKLIMVDFSLGEEEIELTLSADINNLQGEIMKSEGPVVIDIMKFLEYFENPGTDKMSKFEYFNKLINSFASLKKLSKNKAIETLYNISFESLPNNINDIDLENDISEIGIMYRGIKEEKIKEEFINTLKNRIVVKNKVKEERDIDLEQNRNNKNLEKMLAKILSKQEELKGEQDINIEEIKLDVENKTIKENKDEYEEILRDNNISEILKKDVSEMTNSEKKIVAKLEILIPVIMDDKNPEISNRNNNNDMARDYRAMLAAA